MTKVCQKVLHKNKNVIVQHLLWNHGITNKKNQICSQKLPPVMKHRSQYYPETKHQLMYWKTTKLPREKITNEQIKTEVMVITFFNIRWLSWLKRCLRGKPLISKVQRIPNEVKGKDNEEKTVYVEDRLVDSAPRQCATWPVKELLADMCIPMLDHPPLFTKSCSLWLLPIPKVHWR